MSLDRGFEVVGKSQAGDLARLIEAYRSDDLEEWDSAPSRRLDQAARMEALRGSADYQVELISSLVSQIDSVGNLVRQVSSVSRHVADVSVELAESDFDRSSGAQDSATPPVQTAQVARAVLAPWMFLAVLALLTGLVVGASWFGRVGLDPFSAAFCLGAFLVIVATCVVWARGKHDHG